MLQPPGQRLEVWWPLGRPEYAPALLLTEGEADALAAISALAARPVAALPEYAVGALPGTGFPVKRLVAELRQAEARFVYLAFDADPAGFRLTRRVGWELDPAGIRVAPLAILEGHDLAETLAAVEPARRGKRLEMLLREAEAGVA
jgi:hypothetical protein